MFLFIFPILVGNHAMIGINCGINIIFLYRVATGSEFPNSLSFPGFPEYF